MKQNLLQKRIVTGKQGAVRNYTGIYEEQYFLDLKGLTGIKETSSSQPTALSSIEF